jgi:hypothetical protein
MVIMFFLVAMTSPRAASSGITAPRVLRGFSGMWNPGPQVGPVTVPSFASYAPLMMYVC